MIELTIVLAIAGALMISFISAPSYIDIANSRKASGMVTAAIRESFDRASLSGSVHRLSVNVGGQLLKLEQAEGFFSLPAVPLEIDGQGRAATHDEEDEEESFLSGLSVEAKMQLKNLRAAPSWTPSDGELGGGALFPGSVRLLGLWTDSLEKVVTSGPASLHFFPRGETQDALFWLGSNEDDVITVRVDGLAGRVRVIPGRVNQDGEEL